MKINKNKSSYNLVNQHDWKVCKHRKADIRLKKKFWEKEKFYILDKNFNNNKKRLLAWPSAEQKRTYWPRYAGKKIMGKIKGL